MARSKTSKTTAVTSDRRLQAMQLRMQGLNCQEIADEMGISKPAAWKLIDSALKDYAEAHREVTEQHVQTQLLRYEAIIQANYADATSTTSKERFFAAKTIKECQVEMAKLLGLYAPTKTELTGKDGAPIATASVATAVDYSKLSTDELTTLLAIMKKAQEKPAESQD